METLDHFYLAIKEDHRIGTAHIALYMALFHLYHVNACINPVSFTRKLLMESAKISGIATYHKCIKELHAYGYIQYIPSYNPAINSAAYLLRL